MKIEVTVEQLLDELEQNLNTIEFLYGCLTDPTYKHAYPEMTVERIERLRKIVGPRHYCIHSFRDPNCERCMKGEERRALRHSLSEKLGVIEVEMPD